MAAAPTVKIRVPSATLAEIDEMAASESRTRSQQIRHFIKQAMAMARASAGPVSIYAGGVKVGERG